MLTPEESERCSRLLRSLGITPPVTAAQVFEMAAAFTASADKETDEERRHFFKWKSACALDAAALLERSTGEAPAHTYDEWTTALLNEDIEFVAQLADRLDRLNHSNTASRLREIGVRMRNMEVIVSSYS